MSDSTGTLTDVVVEPETPSSPQTLMVDALLLGLEYFLVKWLIKKWKEFEGDEGPPTRRCSEKVQVPPLPSGDPSYMFILTFSHFTTIYTRAKSRGRQIGVLRLSVPEALWNSNPSYNVWKGWNWHIEFSMKDGSLIPNEPNKIPNCYLWWVGCPGKKFAALPADVNNHYYLGLLCCCMSGYNEEDCETSSTNCQTQGNQGQNPITVFFDEMQTLNRLGNQNPTCPCPRKCCKDLLPFTCTKCAVIG